MLATATDDDRWAYVCPRLSYSGLLTRASSLLSSSHETSTLHQVHKPPFQASACASSLSVGEELVDDIAGRFEQVFIRIDRVGSLGSISDT